MLYLAFFEKQLYKVANLGICINISKVFFGVGGLCDFFFTVSSKGEFEIPHEVFSVQYLSAQLYIYTSLKARNSEKVNKCM